MRSLVCFTKKEFLGWIRSKKAIILALLFIAFGVLNPLFAKLIPFLFKALDETMSEMGMVIPQELLRATDVESWSQYYENAYFYMIVFFIMVGNIFTKEYGSTLILVVTKGFDRYKVLVSKAFVLCALWTVYYLVYFGSTYLSTYLIFDAGLAQSVGVAALFLWLSGIWMCAMTVYFSAVFKSFGAVLAVVLGSSFALDIFGIIPKIAKFLPTTLMDGTSLVYGLKTPEEYLWPLAIVLVSTVAFLAASVPTFNKKQL